MMNHDERLQCAAIMLTEVTLVEYHKDEDAIHKVSKVHKMDK